jgi:hypothetical protein
MTIYMVSRKLAVVGHLPWSLWPGRVGVSGLAGSESLDLGDMAPESLAITARSPRPPRSQPRDFGQEAKSLQPESRPALEAFTTLQKSRVSRAGDFDRSLRLKTKVSSLFTLETLGLY